MKIGKFTIENWQLAAGGVVAVFGFFAMNKKNAAASTETIPNPVSTPTAAASTASTGSSANSGTMEVLSSLAASNKTLESKLTDVTKSLTNSQTSVESISSAFNQLSSQFSSYQLNTEKQLQEVKNNSNTLISKVTTPTPAITTSNIVNDTSKEMYNNPTATKSSPYEAVNAYQNDVEAATGIRPSLIEATNAVINNRTDYKLN
jgi:hypothetical protein